MQTDIPKQKLRLLRSFQNVLKDYTPSNESLELLNRRKLVLLVGPTAAGRNTLIGLLLKTGKYHSVISDTTRMPRVNQGVLEKNGSEYWFKTEEDFLDGLEKGRYIEAAIIHHQQVSGVCVDQLEKAAKDNKIAINEVEIAGATTYKKYKPDTICIFLLPPDFSTWMQRIMARGVMTTEELHRRLHSAVFEIFTALNDDVYNFIINHDIEKASQVVNNLILEGDYDTQLQQTARKHAKSLLADIRDYLEL
jgi:guanylate kinase